MYISKSRITISIKYSLVLISSNKDLSLYSKRIALQPGVPPIKPTGSYSGNEQSHLKKMCVKKDVEFEQDLAAFIQMFNFPQATEMTHITQRRNDYAFEVATPMQQALQGHKLPGMIVVHVFPMNTAALTEFKERNLAS